MKIALLVPVSNADLDSVPSILLRHESSVEQARALASLGAEVSIYLDAPRNDRVDHGGAIIELVASGSARRGLAPAIGAPRASHLVARAVSDRPLVIQLFHFLDPRGLFASARASIPVFGEYNGGAPPTGTRRLALARVARHLRGVFFTSRDLADPFLRAGVLAPSMPIHEVPEVSSSLPRRNRAEARASAGLSGEPEILAVMRVEAPKDPWCALAAFRAVLARESRSHLTWVTAGGAELESFERAIASDAEVGSRVTIRRRVPREAMADLYAGADVLLHTSRREVCGYAFVEAMGAGLPIVASDIPAFRAMAAEGTALCPPGDPDAFARAVVDVCSTAARRREAALAHFDAHLSFEAIARRKIAVFRAHDLRGQSPSPWA